MSPSPIFPADRAQLKAFSPVLDIACADTRSAYEKVKSGRVPPAVSDVAGAPYRACSIDSLKSVVDGDCKSLFDDLMYCNGKYEYDYGKKCHSIRRSLLECAVKNKIGELGKNYAM
eukprot:CAMPEP_0176248268 /NCGR_PEP_ID=MMETSP0121_2-20121125/33381_1 /TAXON_ID=160619 /ORGANISM="Kryptoperidinium foliaceum, Strain CCMP 1326" /LENGTH=115 /DNA_ID=CAMNT_0017587945 /DNA_START=70 /DNA_END=417 /DNA_ORIENTATION=+